MSSVKLPDLVLNSEVSLLLSLFYSVASSVMVSAPWSFQTHSSSDQPFLLANNSAIVEYLDLNINCANNELLPLIIADRGCEILTFLSNKKTV